MARPKKAEPADTNIKIRKSSRARLQDLKGHFRKNGIKIDGYSDVIDHAYQNVTGLIAPREAA